jgi:RNA polymerase sigma-70 factor (ECF subfamily)
MQPSFEDFSRLYRTQARSLLAFFQRRVHDPELATDLMAEAFTLALERRDQFRGTTDDQLSGWLWAIAQNLLLHHERRAATERRTRARTGVQRRALSDEELERIDELGGNKQLRAAVIESMALLPDDAREAVRLRFVEELPYEAIATQLGITPSGVRTAVTRALRALSRQLQHEHDEARRP